jgi:hypothetical protein
MKAANKARLLEIAQKLKRRAVLAPPLIVLHSPELPATSEAEIEAAQRDGRNIVHVRFEDRSMREVSRG